MKRIIKLIMCFFNGHKKINKKCVNCGCEFGVPKFENPPSPPPKKIKYETNNKRT
jgi:hypothetical protein